MYLSSHFLTRQLPRTSSLSLLLLSSFGPTYINRSWHFAFILSFVSLSYFLPQELTIALIYLLLSLISVQPSAARTDLLHSILSLVSLCHSLMHQLTIAFTLLVFFNTFHFLTQENVEGTTDLVSSILLSQCNNSMHEYYVRHVVYDCLCGVHPIFSSWTNMLDVAHCF